MIVATVEHIADRPLLAGLLSVSGRVGRLLHSDPAVEHLKALPAAVGRNQPLSKRCNWKIPDCCNLA